MKLSSNTLLWTVVVLLIPFSANLLADTGTGTQNLPAEKEASSSSKILAKKGELSITPERETAVMMFIERNHADLKEVLVHLKLNRRKEYEKAIRELYRESERINQVKDNNPKLYDLELKAWTIKSRIQLVSARLAMGNHDELRGQLKELINEQIDVRLAIMRNNRDFAQQRVKRIDQEMERLEAERQRVVEDRLRLLTKSAADSQSKVKLGAKKSGVKKPANKKPLVDQPTESFPKP